LATVGTLGRQEREEIRLAGLIEKPLERKRGTRRVERTPFRVDEFGVVLQRAQAVGNLAERLSDDILGRTQLHPGRRDVDGLGYGIPRQREIGCGKLVPLIFRQGSLLFDVSPRTAENVGCVAHGWPE